jgi:membrane-anchored protein YejM (alkaline phosphatase superfamily)
MDPVPFFNRYRTSVRFVDDLSKKVFDALDEAGEAENTVVVITGDHGQEFNDNKQNFWGHNGNFTPAQTQVPFVIIGPGIVANNFTSSKNLSSHEDLVPTLMKKYLGLNTSSNDFSTGVDLLSFHNKERDWLISSSYSAYAMITRNRILEVGASGQYQFLDLKNQMVKSEEPDFRHLKDVLEHLSRFKTK